MSSFKGISFDMDGFDSLIKDHSYNLLWYKKINCPCLKEETTQPHSSCINCQGKGFYYFDEQEITGLVKSATNERNFINWSELIQGSAYLTVSNDYRMSFLDKIEFIDSSSIFTQSLKVQKDSNDNFYIELNYEPKEFLYSFKYVNYDVSLVSLNVEIFSKDDTNKYKVIINSSDISESDMISIRYSYVPVYLVLDYLNDFRTIKNNFKTDIEEIQNFPIHLLIRKQHLVKY